MGDLTNAILKLSNIEMRLEYNQRYRDVDLYKEKIGEMNGELEILGERQLSNKYLMASFAIKEWELGQPSTSVLVHSTCAKNLSSIEKSNLNWRLVQRAKYGQGVSFSENVDYANHHSSFSINDERAYILVHVLHKTVKMVWNNRDSSPRDEVDTYRSVNQYVWVKFEDFTFYPFYVIYYKKPRRCTSNFYIERW